MYYNLTVWLCQRLFKNFLKKDIADAAGVSLMGYYRYEKGDRQPTADKIIALADFFNVSTDYLLGRTDNPNVLRN